MEQTAVCGPGNGGVRHGLTMNVIRSAARDVWSYQNLGSTLVVEFPTAEDLRQ